MRRIVRRVHSLISAQSASGPTCGRLARACGIRVAEFNAIDLHIPQDRLYAGIDPLPLAEQAISRCCSTPRCRLSAIDERVQIERPDRRRSAEVGFSDVGISDRPARQGDRAIVCGRCWRRSKRAPTGPIAPASAARIAGWSDRARTGHERAGRQPAPARACSQR